jgi:hypothetical protein
LLGKLGGKRPLGRPKRDNIRVDLREIGWESLNWIHLAQDRGQWWAVVNTEMNLLIPQKAGEFLD